MWEREAISRDIGIIHARRGDWLCLERDDPRGCKIGEVLHRDLIRYRTVLPLFREGESVDCLMKRVFVGKLPMDS